MGTVGLSFGSPTSGTGFNVSQTVSQIVANLQNVETPWKTQISTLDSQDTVLSSLGTLLSNLSSDISSLTDFNGVMAQKTGSSSDTNVLSLSSATSSAVAGSHTVIVNNLAATSSGYFAEVASASTALQTGSLQLQVGSGTAQSITITSGETLSDLAKAINNSGVGINASILTDSTGSRLSLVSATSGAKGNITVTGTLATSTGTTLNYTSAVTGVDASMTVDGITGLTSSSNTVSNLIPGVTFQLLSSSTTPVQVVIGNDNTGVESTVAQMVNDYNSLISAVHAQEGNNASGVPQPLFGSPTLSILQSQLLQSLNLQNPNGTLTSVSSASGTTLSAGNIAVQMADGTKTTVHVGQTGTNTASDIYVSGNTLSSIVSGVNSASYGVSYTAGSSTGTGSLAVSDVAMLSGSIVVQGTTVNVPTVGDKSISGLAAAINSANLGVTATVTTDSSGNATLAFATSGGAALTVDTTNLTATGLGFTASVATSSGQSTLAFRSLTSGPGGALSVSTSGLTANPGLAYNSITGTQGTLSSLVASGDTISGSMTIQLGSGATQTIVVGTGTNSGNTIYTNGTSLTDLQNALNTITGVTASISNGTSLSINSTGGNLTVSSNITDNASVAMSYTNSSDLSSLSSLGITVSSTDNGSLQFDATTLDSVLNTDFSGVVGFFQSIDSWGQNFAKTLTNAGTSSTTGTIYLAKQSNSSIESTLNADISREESLISAQQKSLTNQLNSANAILQGIPTQLQSVNELYAAITGYNTNTNG